MRFCFILIFISGVFCVIAQEKKTLNVTDDFGRKQGFWVHKGDVAIEGYYCDTCKYKEGFYVDDSRNGLWTKFYTNTWLVKSEMTYSNNIPNGPYVLYFRDGKVQEQGTLLNGENSGPLIKYWNNDSIKETKNYDELGRLHGYVVNYFPNGTIRLKYKYRHDVKVDTLWEFGSMNVVTRMTCFDSLGNQLWDKRNSTRNIPTVGMVQGRPCLSGRIPDTLSKKEISVVNGSRLLAYGTFEGTFLLTGRYYTYNGDGGLISVQYWANGHFVRDEMEEY